MDFATRPNGRVGRLAILAVAAFVMAGCAGGLIETQEMIPAHGYAAEPLCRSALGGYFLPRTMLTVAATADPSVGSPTAILGMETHADRSQPFCLDYLSSPVSNDKVSVERNEEGLLVSVSTSAEDRTAAIVSSLATTAENLTIAAARTTSPASTVPVDTLNFQFDPFVWDDLILAKAELRRFDLCIYVEGFSFPLAAGLSSMQIQAAGNKWCSLAAHATPRFDPRPYTFASQPVPSEVMSGGILYRPVATYRVVMLRREKGVWELYQSKRMEMPNASPVLSLGVERAMFTTRNTTVHFNAGTLTDVAIDKNSELEGFVQIPLVVAQAIVDVPAQIIQVRLSDTQNHLALVQAQGALLNATANYAQLVGASNAGSPGGRSTALSGTRDAAIARSGAIFGNCRSAGGDPAFCNDFAARQK